MVDIFTGREFPPYLSLTLESEDSLQQRVGKTVKDSGSSNGEGDAAAGSVLHRVSSFNILRTPIKSPRDNPATRKVESGTRKQTRQDISVIVPTWRLKDRMKTVGVGLVMALNVGTDPPDITKPHPCAKLQCWMDPASTSRAKAKEKIGERLEAQYAKWQQQRSAKALKYRRALDPTVEDVRALCLGLRRQARNERILLHYNGHGVPRPTANGEIWVFDKNHTQYIPLCVTDLRQWMGKPSIVVLDCSSAGILMPFLITPLESNDETGSQARPLPGESVEAVASQWVRDTIVLCPTSDQEWLPMHPDYPADIFTSCLTTPIKMALRWFVRRNPQSMNGLNPDVVDAVPGKANDRKTPLGELNWIFTAVTDSIAWNILPKPLFQRLFRQDLLVASMFRNFLLADRILRSLHCSPQSYPPLPPGVCDHPLWQAWDLACETCLCGLMRDGILGNHVLVKPQSDTENDNDGNTDSPGTQVEHEPVKMGPASSVTSPFFSEQLTAFEIWLEFASINKAVRPNEPLESPEQLPVVLQVLLSQAHRVRALTLLRKFLDLGPWAVNLSLSLGIFPYVMKLLQSPEYKQNLVGIWAKILAFDPSCKLDLVKDGALPHFVQHLTWGLNKATMHLPLNPLDAAEQRIMAAFILSATCLGYPQGQMACMRQNLQGTCCALLSSIESTSDSNLDPDFLTKVALAEERVPPKFRLWLCICLGNLVKSNTTTQAEALASGLHVRLFSRLQDTSPDVRTASCFAIGCLLSRAPQPEANQNLANNFLKPADPQGTAPSSGSGVCPGNFPEERVRPQQPMMIRPPGVATSGSGFPVRLQPTFVSQGASGAMTWQPLVQNSNPSTGQRLPGQSISFNSPGLAGTSMGMMGGESLLGDHQAQAQKNLPGRFQLAQGESCVIDPLQAFQDRRRLDVDLMLATMMLKSLSDASSMVRYEAAVVLGCAVEKYLLAFLAAADEASLIGEDERYSQSKPRAEVEGQRPPQFPFPESLDSENAEKFRMIWQSLRQTQHTDVHPGVASAANSIVSYVHEYILLTKMSSTFRDGDNEESQLRPLGRIAGRGTRGPSITSEHDLSRLVSPGGLPASQVLSGKNGPTSIQHIQQNDTFPLRRISSEFGGLMGRPQGNPGNEAGCMEDNFKMNYTLPKSTFFEWKSDTFFSGDKKDSFYESLDPLSPYGALKSYMWRRNDAAKAYCAKVGGYYACLAPKPPKTSREQLNDVLLMEDDASAANLEEEKLAGKKKTLELKQTALLKNDGARSTALLRFHPYEDVLIICDGESSISIWDTEKGVKEFSIRNGNGRGSRFTSTCWINEESQSLLVAGCDDGSIRIWGGIPFSKAVGDAGASLVSGFIAVPNMTPDTSKSGLIIDWQQYSGQLLTAGNCDRIRSWDVHAEKFCNEMMTESDACITTLTTAWANELFKDGKAMGGGYGVGPNLVVAGFSDGSLKVFDTRMGLPVADTVVGLTRGRRQRLPHFKEHGSWVVSTAFTCYNKQYEIVSGSILGDVKIFDLRASRSLRSHSVQRSQMTAMAVHPLIPIIASGSDAQFVKLMTLDGDAIQVIRHSEMNNRRMIGPISCLAFHPHRALLATGGTDDLIHLFSTKTTNDYL